MSWVAGRGMNQVVGDGEVRVAGRKWMQMSEVNHHQHWQHAVLTYMMS